MEAPPGFIEFGMGGGHAVYMLEVGDGRELYYILMGDDDGNLPMRDYPITVGLYDDEGEAGHTGWADDPLEYQEFPVSPYADVGARDRAVGHYLDSLIREYGG